MSILDIVKYVAPGLILLIAVYQLINIILATPVDAEVVGHKDVESYNQGSGGWTSNRLPIYRYTFNGETKTCRSKCSHFSCKEGDTVRIYVSKSGSVFEIVGVIYTVLFAVVLFLILLKM